MVHISYWDHARVRYIAPVLWIAWSSRIRKQILNMGFQDALEILSPGALHTDYGKAIPTTERELIQLPGPYTICYDNPHTVYGPKTFQGSEGDLQVAGTRPLRCRRSGRSCCSRQSHPTARQGRTQGQDPACSGKLPSPKQKVPVPLGG